MGQSVPYSFEHPFIGGQNLIVPSSVKWLARRQFKKHAKLSKSKINNIDLNKLEGFLNSFLDRDLDQSQYEQRPTHAFCPNLRAKPFWQGEDDKVLSQVQEDLKQNFETIRDEYLAGTKKGVEAKSIDTGEDFLGGNVWLNIPLQTIEGVDASAEKNFPNTISVLEKFKDRIFSAEFIVMEADTTLPPHTDATNAYLVCHLGLLVKDNCGVQVKKEIREFFEKDIIFFDQSFAHSAWNKGSATRVNLLITLFHPDLSNEEISFLKDLVNSLTKASYPWLPIILSEYLLLKLKQLLSNLSTR